MTSNATTIAALRAGAAALEQEADRDIRRAGEIATSTTAQRFRRYHAAGMAHAAALTDLADRIERQGQVTREELAAGLKWFVANASGLTADVSSAHSARGNAASEWMRDDDRDFRRELADALDSARDLLTRAKGSTDAS